MRFRLFAERPGYIEYAVLATRVWNYKDIDIRYGSTERIIGSETMLVRLSRKYHKLNDFIATDAMLLYICEF